MTGPRLTYANVMSTLAVFGVLTGGGAWAAARIGTNDIENGAVTARKLHSDAVVTRKIKDGAVTGPKVNESSLGTVPTADIGKSPVAYAHVRPNGTVDAAHSRGVSDANVVNVGGLAGSFCIKGLSGVESAMVSPDEPAVTDSLPTAMVTRDVPDPTNFPDCGGAQFLVGTGAISMGAPPSGAVPADGPFFIWFFK